MKEENTKIVQKMFISLKKWLNDYWLNRNFKLESLSSHLYRLYTVYTQ